MAGKNSVEVVINGKIYQLAGSESESYMHEVASYLNQKILDFQKETVGYNKLDDSIKALLLEVNICDDLFKERKRSRDIQQARDDAERESYAAKHDLVNMQMKLETTLRELENTQKKLAELEAKQAARDARDRALASTKK
ncbi:MAG: cell division protein ZapA [Lachnospiraceae bacterium]|nr:cell division protein ZapA [Lachnospiraceae bacterium]